MKNKPKVMISFRNGGENGGPFVSHKRIIESNLKEKYTFVPLVVPKGHLGILNIKALKNIIMQIKKENPDIVHLAGLQLEGFHVALACRIAGVKSSVLAVHGSSNEALSFPKYKKKILNILEVLTLKLCHTTYGVSEYVSGWKNIQKYSNNYFGHIYNLSHTEYKPSNDCKSIREELNIDEDTIVIVSTGRITREKGYPVLCKVIKNINTDKKIAFIIAGDGEYLEEMKKDIEEECLKYRVIFLGYRNDIDRILEGSDIFVIATLHETLCNSLIEAGKHGLALVGSDVGGIPEIIQDGVNGYLTEVNDSDSIINALIKLIEDERLKRIFGQKSQKHILDNFNAKYIIGQIDKLYRSVLDNDK